MQGRFQNAQAAFKRSLALRDVARGDAHPLVDASGRYVVTN